MASQLSPVAAPDQLSTSPPVSGLAAYTTQLSAYWDSVRGMPRKAWDWSRRNKRWIIGGVAVGAVAVYWLRPYYQQFRELQSIVSEANRIMEEGGEGKPGEPKISKRQREHHARVMAMANNLILTGDSIDRLRVWLQQAYEEDIDRNIPRKLKALKGPGMAEEKQRLFTELQKLCFSRLVTSLITLHLILLTQRVALSAGTARQYRCGEWRKPKKQSEGSTGGDPNAERTSSEMNAELAAYLRAIGDHLTSPLVLCLVDHAAREACGLRLPTPTSRETASGIASTLRTVVEAALQGLFKTGSETPKSALVVPPMEEAEIGGQVLVAETMDLVDSPHYEALLKESMNRACERVSEYLCEGLSLVDGTNTTIALAKTIPLVNKAIENNVLVNSEANVYLLQFNQLECVQEFSDIIYYRAREGEDSQRSDDEGEPASLEAIMQALVEAAGEEPSAAKT